MAGSRFEGCARAFDLTFFATWAKSFCLAAQGYEDARYMMKRGLERRHRFHFRGGGLGPGSSKYNRRIRARTASPYNPWHELVKREENDCNYEAGLNRVSDHKCKK